MIVNKLIRRATDSKVDGFVIGYNVIAGRTDEGFNLDLILDINKEIKIEIKDKMVDTYSDSVVVVSVSSCLVGSSVRYVILVDGQQSEKLLGAYIVRANINGDILELYKKSLL